MKNYLITITKPAVAELKVEADTSEEAVDKAKIILAYGKDIDFTVDTNDRTEAGFTVSELTDGKTVDERSNTGTDLTKFVVALDAFSHKEVPLQAISEEAALAIAREMYFGTDALDFNDDDVVRVTASVTESTEGKENAEEEPSDLKLYYLTKIVREIRKSTAPDELIARVLRDGLEKVYAKGAASAQKGGGLM